MNKTRTQDFAQRHMVHTTEQIGLKQAITPEGFLLCSDVPLARVGWMLYGAGELTTDEGDLLTPDDQGFVTTYRGPEELFRAETVASAVGKPVVNDHPDGDVTPLNWTGLSKGIAINVRPGEDEHDDVILADLLITDADAIRDVLAGKREVSMGYRANYTETAPGQALTTDIIFNHIALVERGRCGPRCSIGDRSHHEEGNTDMTTVTVPGKSKATRVRKAFRDAEQTAMEALGEKPTRDDDLAAVEEDGNHVHVHLHNGSPEADATEQAANEEAKADPAEARFVALEQGFADIGAKLAALADAVAALGKAEVAEEAAEATAEAEEFTGDALPADKPGVTKDSAALETSYRATLALAEVLVPGFRMPTFDAKAKRVATVDALCAARRKALDAAYATQDGKALVDSINDGAPDMAAMSCADIAGLFKSAAGAKKLLNNTAAARDAGRIATPALSGPAAPMSIAELNKRNAAFYAAKH